MYLDEDGYSEDAGKMKYNIVFFILYIYIYMRVCMLNIYY